MDLQIVSNLKFNSATDTFPSVSKEKCKKKNDMINGLFLFYNHQTRILNVKQTMDFEFVTIAIVE